MPVSVLLVDDSEIIRAVTRAVVQKVFRERQVEIVEAEDGTQAIAAAATRRFDLILLDILLDIAKPEVDGFAVLKQLRAAGSVSKVIVLSADMQGGAMQRMRDLGASAFLPKPVLEGALAQALTACGLL